MSDTRIMITSFSFGGMHKDRFDLVRNDIFKLTPKIAKSLLAEVGRTTGEVTRMSANPQNGEVWYTTYRITRKSCRRTFDGYR